MSQRTMMIEVPRLNLALHGFDPHQLPLMQDWLANAYASYDSISVRWQLSVASTADVLLHALEPDDAREKANLGSSSGGQCVHRVFWANALERKQESLERSQMRLVGLLISLDGALQMQCLRYVIAGMLVDRHVAKLLMKGVWQLLSEGELIAVVDLMQLKVFIRPDANYLQLDECDWVHRPASAKQPGTFTAYSLERMMWEYARRSDRQLLPKQYFQLPIHLRRYPRLPISLMSDLELAVLVTLRQKAFTVEQLAQRLSLSLETVAHVMGALYFAGAIRTQAHSLWQRIKQPWQQAMRPPFPAAPTTATHDASIFETPNSLLLGQTRQL